MLECIKGGGAVGTGFLEDAEVEGLGDEDAGAVDAVELLAAGGEGGGEVVG